MENVELKLGFDKIRQKLKSHCISALGKEQVELMRFSKQHSHIKLQLEQTAEFVHLLDFHDNFPTAFYIDLRQSLSKIRLEGTYLTTNELFQLKRSLESIKSIVQFFKRTDEAAYPKLKQLIASFSYFPFIVEQIDRIINKFGEIKDTASPELQQIRSQIHQKQGSLSRRMQQILKMSQQEGWVEADAEVNMRDGKILIPVPANHKRKIKGFIHDQSASGKTFYIEPAEIVDTNNEIRELEFDEKREVIKILVLISQEIRPYIDDLNGSYETLGVVDFIRAKALFAKELNAVFPAKFEDKAQLSWTKAIHPLLFLNFKKEKRQVVPLEIFFTPENRIILISGPNAGGKSVCLKTVGLLQYMLQCGMLTPIGHSSETGIFDKILVDIGDEQSIENDLSTYSSHLYSMKNFLKQAGKQSLILIDEFGTGTEPMLGGAIAEAVLQQFNNQEVYGVITTHYTNLKHFATSTPGIINGAMLFDMQKLEPLYQLKVGKPGSSFAFEIATKIGLPNTILEAAKEKIGSEHVNYDKSLKAIERDRRYFENKRKKIRQQEKKLDELVEQYEEKLKNALKKQKELEQKAKQETEELLADVNKRIENTIFEIKSANAEKEKTKEARKKLDDLKDIIKRRQDEKSEKIEAQMQRILQRRERKKNNKKEDVKTNGKPEISEKKDRPLIVGDFVKLENQDTIGEIQSIDGKQAMVIFGNIQANIALKKLEIANADEAKKQQKSAKKSGKIWKPDKSRTDFMFNLDVRGKRADEALQIVSRHLEEAITVQAGEIKILHGTGNGILKNVIRDYLRTVDIVSNYRDEILELGGAGITVVELDY